MKKINLDTKILFLLWMLLILALIPSYAHYGNFLYDNGREAYYPMEMLSGNVLYKNIFNLYGPFAYLFNAALYKAFGINLNVLYIAGCLNTFLIITTTYLISRMFLSRILSFTIGIFTIAVGVLNFSLFNYIFPYSYAMIYGLSAFLFSVLFLLKYQEMPQKNHFLYLSSFFCGIAIANKYEFWAYSLVLLYFIFTIKKLNLKEYFFTALSFTIIPVICFLILIFQGVNKNDLYNTYLIILNMFHSKTLKFFYSQQGMYPTKEIAVSILKNGTITLTSLALMCFGFDFKNNTKIKFKVIGTCSIFISVLLLVLFQNPEALVFLPFLLLALFILKFKQIWADKKSLILFLSVYALSLKNLFGIISLTYGLFYISFWVLTILAIAFKHFKVMQNKDKIISIFLIILSLLFVYVDLDFSTVGFQTKDYPLVTAKGTFYIDKVGCDMLYDLFNYINFNTMPNDKIVVVPEGTFINYITDRASDNYLNLLTPTMFEALGENKIIQRFKQVKPQYVIIHDNPMDSSYKVRTICNDYAFKFCDFIKQDYYLNYKITSANFNFYIFKIRKY